MPVLCHETVGHRPGQSQLLVRSQADLLSMQAVLPLSGPAWLPVRAQPAAASAAGAVHGAHDGHRCRRHSGAFVPPATQHRMHSAARQKNTVMRCHLWCSWKPLTAEIADNPH